MKNFLLTITSAISFMVSANAAVPLTTSFSPWSEDCVVDGNTLTFSKAWAGASSNYTDEDGKCADMSDYDYIWVTFSETTCDFQFDTQYTSEYNQDVMTNGKSGDKIVGVKLNQDYSDQFAGLWLQGKDAGKLVVTGAYAGTEEEFLAAQQANAPVVTDTKDLQLTGFGKWADGIEITENTDGTMTVVYPGDWNGISKWLGDFDASNYDYLILEIEPQESSSTQLYLEYQSVDENGTNNSTEIIQAGGTSCKIALDAARKDKIAQVGVQSASPTTLVIKRIYWANETTAVKSINAEQTQNGVMYNLNGQIVDESYKGIVIYNGKKSLRR